MPILFKRKVIQIGDSLGITIPDDVANSYGIKKGDILFLIADALDDVDGFLLVDLMKRSKTDLWNSFKSE